MATVYVPSASGWSDNGTQGDNAKLRLKIERVYNSATNKSTVTITPQSYATYWGGKFQLLANASLTLNGNTVYSGGGTDQSSVAISVTYAENSNWVDVVDDTTGNPIAWTATVDHSSNGSATFSFGVNFRFYRASGTVYTTFYSLSGSFSVSEARASSVSASNGTFGSAVAITVTRQSTSFTHTVTVSCLGRSTTVATKTTTTSLSWTGAVATYAPLLTNGMNTTATITCTTYSGNTVVGSASVTITMTLPSASVKPSTSIATSDPNGYASTYGGFVAGKSKVTVTLTNSLKYSATLVSTNITANGSSYSSSPATTDVIQAGNTSVTAKITDSRGQTSATASASLTVLAYTAPAISAMTVQRCNSNGTLNNSGAYCKLSYTVAVTALNNHNSKTLKYTFKKRSASSWGSETTITLSSYSQSGSVIFAADTESTYDVKLILADDFNSGSGAITLTKQLSTAYAFLNFGAGSNAGIGIGMVNQTSKAVEMAASWSLIAGEANITEEFYKTKGATFTGMGCPCFGFTSSDGKKAVLFVFLGKLIPYGWNVTCSKALSNVVTVNGTFLGGAFETDLVSYLTLCQRANTLLRMDFENSSGWGVTPKTPLIGTIALDVVVGATS